MQKRILIMALLLGMIVGTLLYMPLKSDRPVSAGSTPVIYLTFDDGPSENTREILDILDAYDIKATFFVTAANPGAYDEITDAYQRGHTTGLHTATHNYEAIYSSVEAYMNDLAVISQLVEERTGTVPKYIRFPGGSSNTISERYCQGIMQALVTEVEKQGYLYFDWNAEIGDATEDNRLESIIAKGKAQADGVHDLMLLCHDGIGNQNTVQALPVLIEYYQSLGYHFVKIDDDSPGFHHRIFN